MRACIDKVGGWKAFRKYIDDEFAGRMQGNTLVWDNGSIHHLYWTARWSWPFGDEGTEDFPEYEPFEPRAG